MTNDYFPLAVGRVLEYEAENASGLGAVKIEIISIEMKGDKMTAQCRRTTKWGNEPENIAKFVVVKDAKEVRSDTGTEFVFPLKLGKKWNRHPNAYVIEALDAEVETPAGRFRDCLKVVYLIAGGDAGSGERNYAPGVGLVKVVHEDEADPFEHRLKRFA